MWTSLGLLPGFALLLVGAGLLVSGACGLARRLGVSDLVIGLTIVAFGTSAPELVVSLMAAGGGSTDVAVANVLGSNTFNILVILGVSAVIRPLTVASQTVWKEIPLSLLAAVMVGILGNDAILDGRGPSGLGRIDGLVLLSFFVVFLYYVFSIIRRDPASAPPGAGIPSSRTGPRQPGPAAAGEAPPAKPMGLPKALAWVGLGLAGLNLGAKLTVDGAVALARAAGVTEWAIGLTIVAAGTSLPELATSALAAWRRNADLAVGNIVGSNIFNVFCILGLSATLRPLPLADGSNVDVCATIVASALLLACMFTGRRRHLLERWEGVLFLGLYAAYLAYLLA